MLVKKNIMVMVLSDVQFDKLDIRESCYPDIGRKVRTTNESAIRMLKKQLDEKREKIDRIYAFATQTVQTKIMNKSDKENPYLYQGKEISHLDYIIKQVEDILDKDCWQVIRENRLEKDNVSLPMDRTLFYTLQVADKIKQYIDEIRGKDPAVNIVLHADCTGGPRHAIMMLIDIIRLLQYNAVEIGKIFYSNWNREKGEGKVETVNDVYDFYNLIAGAEEFVNFGSVKDIQRYFEQRNISNELKELLEAMAEFADEVKLCRRWRFVDAVDHLREAVKSFETKRQAKKHSTEQVFFNNDDVNLSDMLMLQLLPQIKKAYGMLLSDNQPTSLTLIAWCLDQNLLQQALTLYTESIPDILFASKLIVMNEAKKQELNQNYKKNGKQLTKGYYFLINFGYESEKFKKNEYNKKVRQAKNVQAEALKKLFCELIRKRSNVQAAKEAFCKLDEAYRLVHIQGIPALGKVFEWLELLWQDKNKLNSPGTYRVLQQTIIKMYWRSLNKGKKDTKPSDWDKLDAKVKFKRLVGFLKGNIDMQSVVNLAGGIGERGSFNVGWRLFEKGYFVINTDPQKLYKFIDGYTVIKNERNHTNHAKEQQGAFDTAESLINFIQKNLKQLKTLKPKKESN